MNRWQARFGPLVIVCQHLPGAFIPNIGNELAVAPFKVGATAREGWKSQQEPMAPAQLSPLGGPAPLWGVSSCWFVNLSSRGKFLLVILFRPMGWGSSDLRQVLTWMLNWMAFSRLQSILSTPESCESQRRQ